MLKQLFNLLANLKVALILLLIIAIFSSLGSIIEQNREIEFYQQFYSSTILGVPIWKLILVLGFDNLYSTGWFLSLIFLLGLSLICCTIFQQFPTLKFSRRYYFYKSSKQFNKLFLKLKATRFFRSHLSYLLLTRQYSLFYQYRSIYAYKGLISRIGPIIVHLSLICVLIGSTLSAVQGFNAQEVIPKTELFHIQNIIKNGVLSRVSQKTFRINDFWSTYTNKGKVKQFYSDISILNNSGLEIKRKTISVNNPLLLDDIVIYQTDWGISGIRLGLKQNHASQTQTNFQLPVLKTNDPSQKIWVSSLITPESKVKGIIMILKNNRGQLMLFNLQGEFLKMVNLGETFSLENKKIFNFLDTISSTGIQIKSDPGIELIYFGFFFLIISSCISYLAFSEFWVLAVPQDILLGAKTNRSKFLLNIEFLKIKQSFLN